MLLMILTSVDQIKIVLKYSLGITSYKAALMINLS